MLVADVELGVKGASVAGDALVAAGALVLAGAPVAAAALVAGGAEPGASAAIAGQIIAAVATNRVMHVRMLSPLDSCEINCQERGERIATLYRSMTVLFLREFQQLL